MPTHLFVFDFEKSVQNHGTAFIEIHWIGGEIRLLLLFWVPSVNFEVSAHIRVSHEKVVSHAVLASSCSYFIMPFSWRWEAAINDRIAYLMTGFLVLVIFRSGCDDKDLTTCADSNVCCENVNLTM